MNAAAIYQAWTTEPADDSIDGGYEFAGWMCKDCIEKLFLLVGDKRLSDFFGDDAERHCDICGE